MVRIKPMYPQISHNAVNFYFSPTLYTYTSTWNFLIEKCKYSTDVVQVLPSECLIIWSDFYSDQP